MFFLVVRVVLVAKEEPPSWGLDCGFSQFEITVDRGRRQGGAASRCGLLAVGRHKDCVGTRFDGHCAEGAVATGSLTVGAQDHLA